jgi:hypothetical protein
MANSTAKFLNWIAPNLPKNDDKQYIGIGGFTMFVAISEGTNFSASAPDIVCEDLTTVQDSVINAPKTYSLSGEVADIFIETTPETGIGAIFEKVLNKAAPYLPARTLSQIQKIEEQLNEVENVIDSIDSIVKDAKDIYSIIGNKSASASIKDEFFYFIERVYDSKTIINIENKSRTQQQVLITGFSYTETNDGDTGDFSLTFKEIRIASIDLFRDSQNLSDGEKAKVEVNKTLNGQLDSEADKGLSDGIKVVQDKAVQAFNSIGLNSVADFVGDL